MNTENYLYTNLESYQDDIDEMNDTLENALNTIKELKAENEHLRTDIKTFSNTIIEVNKECNSLFNHLTKKI